MKISFENRKINIVLVEYINRNLGDTVIAECAKFFVQEALHDAQISNYMIHEYNMYQRDMEYIRNADVIIFAGGGLIKYKREYFYQYVPEIINIAQENDIPVFINCTGVEGYDENDKRCRQLKTAINCACVKGVTVRDDYATFKNNYLESEKEWIGKVMDSAAFSSEIYQVSKCFDAKKIGLGIAREGLFFDYGYQDVTKQFQLDFWKLIIAQLEALGYQWEIFNNGLHSDYEFGLEVLEYAGIEEKEKYIRKRPAEGMELARMISQYKGIIATRLHSNIIAFSLGCPSIGLIWNEKLMQWGERIGYPERFVRVEDMRAAVVVERLQQAMTEGCAAPDLKEKNKIQRPLCEFMKRYAVARTQRTDESDKTKWENILVASALGGKNSQFTGMNSPDTILDAYNKGFRLFEADLKLSSDKKLVCVNGWTKSTFCKLGQPVSEENMITNGLEYRKFMEAKYYDGHYRSMDWKMLVGYMCRLQDSKFILDARNNTNSQMALMKEIIKETLCRAGFLRQILLIKIMKKEELDIVKDLGVEMMYEIPSEAERKELQLTDADVEMLCKSGEISRISMRRDLFNALQVEKIKSHHKKICVSSCNKISELIELTSLGVDRIGTDYLTVDGVKSLLH